MSAVLQARSQLGVASRTGSDEDRLVARRNLAEAKIAAYIQRTVAEAPPLTNEQRSRIVSLIGVL